MASSRKTVQVQGDASEYVKKAEAAAKKLGWEIKSSTGNKLEATTGFNLITLFGEKISIDASGSQAKIVSKTKNPLLITAWGRNSRNISKLLKEMG